MYKKIENAIEIILQKDGTNRLTSNFQYSNIIEVTFSSEVSNQKEGEGSSRNFAHKLTKKGPEVVKSYQEQIQKGIKGIFSIDQSKRFKATINVRLEIFKDQGKSIARASASRSQTLREDASPNLQSRLWYNLVELVMKSFDREMRHQINTHLKPYIS